MKQKEFPLNPAALHLGMLLLQENEMFFDFSQKMSEDDFAEIYNKFCEKVGDGYGSSYNGLYYNGLSDEYYFPFNEKYAIACSKVSPFYCKINGIEFEFEDYFTRFMVCYNNNKIILSELFPQKFDLDIRNSWLNPMKGRIFKSRHKFLSLKLETYLERVPVELAIELMNATKYAFDIQ